VSGNSGDDAVGRDGKPRNDFSGAADAVVQARSVRGGVHIHPPRNRTADACAARTIKLFAKTADQFGSDKARIRLAGVHALERIAQANPDQRQAVVNLLCSYLRMPYQPPAPFDDQTVGGFMIVHRHRSRGKPPAAGNEQAMAVYGDQMQEYEVRLATQRLFADHLRPGDPDDPAVTPWTDIDLDLTGATLIDFTLAQCRIRTATFETATFLGHTDFTQTVFTGSADFRLARFADSNTIAYFQATRFAETANFTAAAFPQSAAFAKACFDGPAYFAQARQ
jgi:hypothetical protein